MTNIDMLLPAEALAGQIEEEWGRLLQREEKLMQPVAQWISDGEADSPARCLAIMAQSKAFGGHVDEIEKTRKALVQPYMDAIAVINDRLKPMAALGDEKKKELLALLKTALEEAEDGNIVDPNMGTKAYFTSRLEVTVVDPIAVPLKYWTVDAKKVKAAVTQAIKDDEILEIPGVSVETTKTPQVR